MISLTPDQLSEVSRRTLGHYDRSADAFWEGTRDHDVSQNIQALLRHIDGTDCARILDFGCGPGRDLAAFKALGHEPVGLDGAPNFCKMARQYTGCEVLQQDFLALDLPAEHFHGVFANATLFHVPTSELGRVLSELRNALMPGGVLMASNPRGSNMEGFQGERYGAYHDLGCWRGYLTNANFEELEHYYRPDGLPREQQPWLVTVWRKSL